jgi:hypothetical protein
MAWSWSKETGSGERERGVGAERGDIMVVFTT